MIKSEWLKLFRSSTRNRRPVRRRSENRPAAIERLEDRALLAAQVIVGSPAIQDVRPGGTVNIDATYLTEDDNGDPSNAGSNGLGLRLHYDSTKLTVDLDGSGDPDLQNLFQTGLLGVQDQDELSTGLDDGDPNTDRFVNVAWFDLSNGWAANLQPLLLYTSSFTLDPGFTGSTQLNFARTGSNPTFADFESNPVIVNEFIEPDISISNATDVTEGGNSLFDVVLSEAPSGVVTIQYSTTDGSATVADSDYTQATLDTITFNPGDPLTQQISIATTADANVEPDEDFTVTLNSATNGNIVAATGTAVILNDDVPTVSITDAGDVMESGSAVFMVTLDQAPLADVEVVVSTVDVTTGVGDYTPVAGRTLSFTVGGPLTQPVTVQITDDTESELDEDFILQIDSVIGGVADAGNSSGSATILANDAPSVSISDAVAVFEGDVSVFEVVLAQNPAAPLTVDFATVAGTADADDDFTSLMGQLTFNPGQSLTQSIFISTKTDSLVEVTEDFTVELSNIAGGSIADGTATGQIQSADVPSVTVSDAPRINEGGNLVFEVTLDQAPVAAAMVDFITQDGSATVLDGDYTPFAPTTIVFGIGDMTPIAIIVSTFNDTEIEDTEDLFLQLSNPDGVTIARGMASGLIDSEDVPVVTVVNAANTFEGQQATFVVSIDALPLAGQDLTVDLVSVSGTADDGVDYDATSETVTFSSAGPLTQAVTINTTEDNLVETSETFSVTLGNVNGGTIGAAASAQATILDNDFPTVSLVDAAPVAEGQDAVFTVSLDQAPVSTVTVAVNTADGSAESPGDFTPVNARTLTFLPGAPLTQTVSVQTNDDALSELDEDFRLVIDFVSGGGIGEALATAVILVNDDPSISIDDNVVDEQSVNGTARISISQNPARPVTVEFTTRDGSALAGSDYTTQTGSVTFNPGDPLFQDISFPLTNDSLVEASENLFVDLLNPVDGTITDGTAEITLTSEDVPSVTLAGPTPVAEGQAAVFTLTLDQAPVIDGVLEISTDDGTATSPDDFTGVDALQFFFNVGDPLTKTFSVTTDDDALLEADEEFTLRLHSSQFLTIAGSNTATATITSEDVATVSIADVSVTEDNNIVAVISVSEAPVAGRDLTIDVSTADGTAVAGADYTALPTQTLTFTSTGALTQAVTITIADDAEVEVDENFEINLSNVVNGTIDDGQAIATIQDNDVPAVSVSDVTIVNEGDEVVFTISLDQAPVADVVVTVSTQDGSAVALNDFDAITGQVLTFSPGGSLTQTVPVSTIDDTLSELDEDFSLVIDNVDGGSVLDGQGAASISGNDLPRLTIADATDVDEAGEAVFTLTLDQAPAMPLSIDFATADGTAIAGDDYTADSGTLTFTPSGSLIQEIRIVLIDDALVESTEDFFIDLSNGVDVVVLDSQALGTISSTDIPSVSVTSDASSVAEGSDAIFTFTLNQAPVVSLTFDITTTDDTALAGDDYTAVTETITFNPGDPLTQQINVATLDDGLVEGTKSFFVDLSNPTGVNISTGQATGTITSEDVPTISVIGSTTAEGGDIVFTISVDQFPLAGMDSTVEVTTSDDSAIAPDDYTAPASQTLTFTSADTSLSQTITVSTVDDTLVEADESFFLNLTNSTGATIGEAQATGTVTSDDTPVISVTSSQAEEGEDVVFTISVDQLPLAGMDVTVDIATSDDSATATDDYTAIASQTLTFTSGDASLSQTIAVSTVDDTLVEADESFFLDLTNAAGGTIGTGQASGTLTNDDTPVITVTSSQAEEGSNVTFIVSIDQLPLAGMDASVDIATSDDAALAASDYTAVSSTLTFTSADTSLTQQVIVPTTDDAEIEVDETFFLDLSNPVGATLAGNQATGTIINNDTVVDVALSVSANEGAEADGTVITITATTSGNAGEDQTVDLTVAGAGISTADYLLALETITIAAGTSIGSVTLTIQDDAEFEGDETLTVTASNASAGLNLTDATADIVIRDSEAPDLGDIPKFAASLQPTLSWQTAAAAPSYEVYLARLVPSEARLFASESIVSTASFTPSSDLTPGVYRYWIRTMDTNNVGGTWSTGNTFEVQPKLINPVIPTFTARPVFEWFAVPHADEYQIFVRTTDGDIVVDNIADTSWTPDSDLAPGPVFWWIRPSDRKGNLGWSERGETGTQTTVTAPVGSTTDTTPVIQWLETQGAGRYILHVEVASTREVVIREDNVTQASYEVTTALAVGDYRVWVKAIDGASGDFNSGRWSRAFDFSITTAGVEANELEEFGALQSLLTAIPEEDILRPTDSTSKVTSEVTTHPKAEQAVVSHDVHSVDKLMSDPAALGRVFDPAAAVVFDE